MIVNDFGMNNNIIVVLADDKESAMKFGTKLRVMSTTGIMPMHQRSELYLLYGHRGMPLVIVPGTIVQPWHSELDRHLEMGRIILVGKFKRVQGS